MSATPEQLAANEQRTTERFIPPWGYRLPETHVTGEWGGRILGDVMATEDGRHFLREIRCDSMLDAGSYVAITAILAEHTPSNAEMMRAIRRKAR